MFLSEWREFPSAPCLAGGKKNLMTFRVSILLKTRASLTCFRACFLPGRAKDLSAPRYNIEKNGLKREGMILLNPYCKPYVTARGSKSVLQITNCGSVGRGGVFTNLGDLSQIMKNWGLSRRRRLENWEADTV